MIQKIKSCDMNKNFVFVSYSKKDKDKVYPLIVKLQEKGCNVWIDKELISAVGKNWQNGALTAIAEKNCKALLFMVSENSLTSAPVFAELVWSQRSKKVLRNNDQESMKIVPVNVDENWSPSEKGIKEWIENEVGDNEELLTGADYDCMESIGYIDKRYYEKDNINRLEQKGEIAEAIYAEVLESLGGSKITLASVDDIETICMNIPDSVFGKLPEVTEAPAQSEVSGEEETQQEPQKETQEKKSATLTGDVTYTLYGNTYTDNQSNMMLRVFAQVLNHHQEIVPELCNYKGMNCVSRTNYKLEENQEGMPSYFRVCEYFEYPTGSICVGTAYSFADKCKKIALLLNICGESEDVLVSEQIDISNHKKKINVEKSEEEGTGLGRGSSITYSVYGENFTTSQADMLKIVASRILEKHLDKVEAAAEGTYFISLTDYTDIPKEQRPVYYRAMSTCNISGRQVSIGTTFNKQAKISEIAKLIEICGEQSGAVMVEGEVVCPKSLSGSKKKSAQKSIDFFAK